MLEKFTEYAVAFLGLLEAEGRSARKNVVMIGTKLALVVGGGTLLTAALAVFSWALFIALAPAWGRPWAAVACGALLLLLGGGLLWLANRNTKTK